MAAAARRAARRRAARRRAGQRGGVGGGTFVSFSDALPQAGVSEWRPWGGGRRRRLAPPRGEDETPRARGKAVEEFEAEAAEEHFERQRVEGGAF